jgi:lysophospholipase L1-like esterase
MSQERAEASTGAASMSFFGSATRWLRRWPWGLLLAGGCLFLVLSLGRQWLFVGTHRFYLENHPDAATSGAQAARQSFEVRDGRVEPAILVTAGERLSFPVGLRLPSRLYLRAVSTGVAAIEIALVERGARRTLYRGALAGATEIAEPVPKTAEAVELVSEGEVRWVDPRLVDEPNPAARILGLAGLLGLAWLASAGGRFAARSVPAASWARALLFGGVSLGVSVLLGLGVLEVGLRAMGDRLPSWIAVERRNLGEVRADPRWQDSASYGPRLAPNVRAICQWQHGDIVRMGFLPPDLVRHSAYRFPLATDADGFRNAAAESRAPAVAALGDSFTDALTLPAGLTWPARLERLLHSSVGNYGTAGFGPGQELRVLKEYVLPRRPRVVVVAFFAGNDLQDAERFDKFEKSGGSFPSSGLGWKFKEVIARFDQLYLMSFYQGLTQLARDREAGTGDARSAGAPEDYSGEDPGATAAARPSFDRGLFTIPTAGHTLRFAFLPPYLNCLRLSREELQASAGWEATRRSYREMKRLVDAQASRLVVMFIPSKAQVYLPLAESAFSRAALEQAFAVSLHDVPQPPGVEVVMRNRLALNGLMRDFCAEEGIPFLDLTDALRARLNAGSNVYFPDDSHWNAAGHETAATTLAEWLGGQPADTALPPAIVASTGR